MISKMSQSNCKLAIKLDNNQNAIYTPGQLVSGRLVMQFEKSVISFLSTEVFFSGRVIFTLSVKTNLRGT